MQRAPPSRVNRVSAFSATATITINLTYICSTGRMLGRQALLRNGGWKEASTKLTISQYVIPLFVIPRNAWRSVSFFVVLYHHQLYRLFSHGEARGKDHSGGRFRLLRT
jgi:hypothetical protein